MRNRFPVDPALNFNRRAEQFVSTRSVKLVTNPGQHPQAWNMRNSNQSRLRRSHSGKEWQESLERSVDIDSSLILVAPDTHRQR